MCILSLTDADQEPDFVLCGFFFFKSMFSTVIDIHACLVPAGSNLCGAHFAFPFLLESFRKGDVSGCGRLLAQMCHWKNVAEPDVKWTSHE